jgi:hypothetical protein
MGFFRIIILTSINVTSLWDLNIALKKTQTIKVWAFYIKILES